MFTTMMELKAIVVITYIVIVLIGAGLMCWLVKLIIEEVRSYVAEQKKEYERIWGHRGQ